ncbi:hypothetical protein LJC53_07745, partial [Bacteroidales bacterium OttesenSCG-928-C03]|nr:hypothetical protein [Bacteroidales bacterium OttesenSCG-928-C03]
MELGEKQVQGVDYAYTLWGWLKAVNSYTLNSAFDIGKDGYYAYNLANNCFAFDAYSYGLQYFHEDYTTISGDNDFWRNNQYATPLYSGNISSMNIIMDIIMRSSYPLSKVFHYDKINRIKNMQTSVLGNNSEWEAPTERFNTNYSYDFNGNILHLQRLNGNGEMTHDITYHYSSQNNRLFSTDASGLNSSDYGYDRIGNLSYDTGEGMEVWW